MKSHTEDSVIALFKSKYNDIMDLSFKPYDIVIPSFKAFNGDEAICSVSFNPVVGSYQCWYDNDYLVTSDKDKAIEFLKIKNI